jgi:hypothetical protein
MARGIEVILQKLLDEFNFTDRPKLSFLSAVDAPLYRQ